MKLQISEQICTCHNAYFYIIHHCIANSENSRLNMSTHIGEHCESHVKALFFYHCVIIYVFIFARTAQNQILRKQDPWLLYCHADVHFT